MVQRGLANLDTAGGAAVIAQRRLRETLKKGPGCQNPNGKYLKGARMPFTTEEESFWNGRFGDEYIERNQGEDLVAASLSFFSKALDRTKAVHSVLEMGSNVGINLEAITRLLPKARLSAIEINHKAARELKKKLPNVDLHVTSILEFQPEKKWDLVFTKGVLIHINPEKLSTVYELMHRSSSRYVLIAEYYNPEPVEVVYHGHEGKLYKRDFAGEMLDSFPDLSLVDYGFAYHREANFLQGDLTWFLLEKDKDRTGPI